MRTSLRARLLSLILVAMAMPTEKAKAQSTAQTLNVNDVSILFARPRSKSDVDQMLRLDATTPDGVARKLLPPSMFEDILNLAQGGVIADASFAAAKNYSHWRIVGFRFDPCFPRVTANNCRLELRLIAQPIEVIAGTQIIVHDFALHLIYRPAVSSADIAKELLEIKRQSPLATEAFDLGEHPGLFNDMQKPVADRNFTARVKRFLTSRMNDKDLDQVAFLGSNDGVTKWAFWLGKPDAESGTVSGLTIAANRFQLGSHQSFDLPKMGPATFDAVLRDSNDPFIRSNTTVPFFARLSGADVPLVQTIQAAHRIENPNIHIQGSTDCVSCHTATTSRIAAQEMLVAEGGEFAGNPALFNDSSRFPNRFLAAAGMKAGRDQTINNAGMLSNLRMFGYFHSSVAISQRTINESAAVADFSNRNLLVPVLCPTGTSFDKSIGFCTDAINAIGPFTEAMTVKCEQNDGGASCRALRPFSIQGRLFNVQRWGINFARSFRGTGECPLGAAKSAEAGNFCVERVNRNGKVIEEAYGPFPESLINKCIAGGGGDPCFFNRWSAGFLRQLLARP